MGLAVAIHLSQVTSYTPTTYVNVRLDPDQDRFAIVYTSWAWMAFALNSTLSISILLRIRFVTVHIDLSMPLTWDPLDTFPVHGSKGSVDTQLY
jgi:hypothetical protein